MANQPPESQRLPEIENPIIRRAYVMLGPQQLETVQQSLLDDPELQSKTDDELIRIIEEADQHWRDQYQDCVRKPGAIELYAPLMTACCQQRYDRLRQLREVAPEAEQAELTARMGRLLTVNAHCALAGAESLLLNEHFQQAYQLFGQSEWMARALPDEGALRLYEIMWARYGQWVTAVVAGRQEESRSSHAGVAQLLQEIGSPAEECLKRVEQLFSRHRWVLQERQRLREEYRKGQGPPAGPDQEESPDGALLELITSLASAVRGGRITLDTARERVRDAFPGLQIPAGKVRIAALLFEARASINIEQAILYLELNSELALQYQNEPGVQGVCLATLGRAYKSQAMKKGKGFERAIAMLLRAYGITSPVDALDRTTAKICVDLAVCSRELRNMEDALKWGTEAVDRLEKTTKAPYGRSDAMTLGNAYGLRGEGRESAGDAKSALQDHVRALEFFREAGSSFNVREAYHHIADLCMRTNQLDQAVAASNELIDLAEQAGDPSDVAPTSLALARSLVRIGRYETAVLLLDRAEQLVLNALEKRPDDPRLLEYRYYFKIWAARFYGALLRNAPFNAEKQQETARKSYELIEGARRIALQLQRDDLLSEACLEHAMFQQTMGNLDAARQFCGSLDHIPGCPPQLRAFSFLLQGSIAAEQKQFSEALACLDQGLQIPAEEWDDIRVRFFEVRGSVKEHLADRAGAMADYEEAVKRTAGFRDLLGENSRVAVFGLAQSALDRLFLMNAEESPQQDARKALYWAEYGKSRALAELLGQSGLTLPASSPEVSALQTEEQRLLAEVHALRATSLSEAARISFDESHEMQAKKSRLVEIWNELESLHPDYVELRRGAVPCWEEVLQLTAD